MASSQIRWRTNEGIKNKALKFNQRKPVMPLDAVFVSGKILDHDENGKRIQIGRSYKTLSALLAALDNLDAPSTPVEAPVEAVPAERTWKSLRDEYTDRLRLKVKKGILEEGTVSRYLRTFREFDAFLETKNIVSLKEITFRVVEAFTEHRIDNGAPNAYVCDIKNLNPVFEYASRQDFISKNPVEYESPTDDAERGAQPYTAVELSKMVAVLEKDELLFWLLYRTGLRKSDVIELRWKNIGEGIIEGVVPKKTRRRKKDALEIAILPDLEAILRKEREERNPSGNDYVLLDPNTQRPFKADGHAIYNRIVALGNRAGVDDAYPHRFRDTFGQDCLLRGLGDARTAAYMGIDVKTFCKHYKKWDDELKKQSHAIYRSGTGLI